MHRLALLLILFSPTAYADVIVAIGFSNPAQECRNWRQNNSTPHTVICAAQGGWDVRRIHDDPDTYWGEVRRRVEVAGYTVEDVDVVWAKNLAKTNGTPDRLVELQTVHDYLIEIQTVVQGLFPNLRQGWHSPRTSGRWCPGNPNPYARDIRFAIEGRNSMSGATTYFDRWGLGPELDSVEYIRSDFKDDGCHPSPTGLIKTTQILNDFFGP